MQPVYAKKAPEDRKTWIDGFVALKSTGGVHDAVEQAARHGAARHVFNAIVDLPPADKRDRAAA